MIINIFVASPLRRAETSGARTKFTSSSSVLKVGTQSIFKGRHIKRKTKQKGRKIRRRMCRCQLQSLMIIPPELREVAAKVFRPTIMMSLHSLPMPSTKVFLLLQQPSSNNLVAKLSQLKFNDDKSLFLALPLYKEIITSKN